MSSVQDGCRVYGLGHLVQLQLYYIYISIYLSVYLYVYYSALYTIIYI